MEATENRRGKTRIKKFLGGHLDLNYKDHGRLETTRARIVDATEEGIGLSSLHPLAPGTPVSFIDEGSGATVNARVARCHKTPNGDYRIGLQREAGVGVKPDGNTDYYELLQVSPKADPDTIHRVYRILAQRYHPDNSETGDAEMFRRLLEAYNLLTDPARRAEYDLTLHTIRQKTWKVFDSPAAAKGATGEKQKRRAVLWALYNKRLRDNHLPSMGMAELEDLLGIPKEHLEFTFWYLRENQLIVRSDNNKFLITVKGVDAAEALGEPQPAAAVAQNDRLLETA